MQTLPITRIRILIFLLLFFSVNLYALEPIVLENCNNLAVGKYIEYLEDRDKILELEEIQKREIGWTRSQKDSVHFGFTTSRYWLRFAIQNSSVNSQDCILDTAFSRIDLIEFFHPLEDGSYKMIQTGDTYPYSQRDVDHINFAFKINLKPNNTKIFYMNVSSKYNVTNLDPVLHSNESFIKNIRDQAMVNGLFYGFMIIMFFYNLALFVQLKEIVYFYFSAFMFFYVIYFLGIQGTAYCYFYPNFPWIQNRDYQITIPIVLFFSTLFVNTFLDLKTRLHKGYLINKFILIILVIWFLINPFLVVDYFLKFSFHFTNTFLLVALAVTFFNSIYLAFKKFRPAYFYLAAWVLLLLASVLRLLQTASILPANPLVQSSVQIGVSFTMVLLSLGLADKLNFLKNQLQKAKDELEDKVIERTKELNESLVEVKKLKENQDGDYFLNTLLIEPLGKNNASSETVKIDVFIKQKKTFVFRKREHELGGDINISENIKLEGKNYIVFLNGDAMGKSIQGAGGVLVLGTVFKSIIQRTISTANAKNIYPERWLKNAFIEMHKAFESFDGSMLMSAVFGLIDEETGTVYFVNSEHPDIVLYRDGFASFIENKNQYRKLGTPTQTGSISIQIFSLKPNDMIFLGSDGRDDLIIGKDSEDYHIINNDEKLFLSHIQNAKGELLGIYHSILNTGKLMDDLSILRIYFLGKFRDSNKLEANLQLFESYKKERKFDKLLELGNELINDYPHLTNSMYELSLVYRTNGIFEKAIDLGERIRLREPKNISNLITLIESYHGAGKTDRANTILDACLKVRPEDERLKQLRREIG